MPPKPKRQFFGAIFFGQRVPHFKGHGTGLAHTLSRVVALVTRPPIGIARMIAVTENTDINQPPDLTGFYRKPVRSSSKLAIHTILPSSFEVGVHVFWFGVIDATPGERK